MIACPACGRDSSEEFAYCPFCGATLQAPANAPAEVRKTVSVVFCDVTGSTSLGERLDPETLRGVMRRYFQEMTGAIERHGGTVEKFIGDAVMAIFGVPTLHEDDALRAVRAADDMRAAMTWLNKELERDHGVTLGMRIGVNTGEVVARRDAPTGSEGYVIGDAVNVAARFEQVAASGEVVLGEATYRLVRDAVEVEPLAPLELKGKGHPVAAYRLVLIHPHAAGLARRLDSPMVGRTRSLRQLSEAFRTAVEERACYLFTVLGSPGVGKSRLTEEFLASIGDEATVLRGRCLSYGQGITFFPLVEILGQLGLSEIDTGAERERLIALLGGGTEAEVAANRLGVLTGGTGEMTGASEEVFWAVRRLFESLASERPVVVVIDDIHWAEPTLLDLLEHVADWSRESAILLVCPARPELLDTRPGWAGGKLNATTILLEPLSEAECEELVENLLGSTELEGPARRRIAEAAEGNPLFVEQMLAMLIDDGALELRQDRWVAARDLADLTVPPGVQALLTARLDRLPTEERLVLERAAVEGKEFSSASVMALVEGTDVVALGERLRALIRREFIRPHRSDRPGEDGYRFRHQLIRDAAYESIPKRDRAELHRRFAVWFEHAAGEFAGEGEEIVGYHLEHSYLLRAELGPPDAEARADGDRAARLLFDAGVRALDRDDPHAAANLLRRAAVLVPRPDPHGIRIGIELGDALYRSREFARSREVIDEAIADAERVGDASLTLLARLRRTTFVAQVDPAFSISGAMALAREAIERFRATGEPAREAVAWETLSSAFWGLGRWASMQDPAEHAIELARSVGDQSLELRMRLRLLSALYYGTAPTSVAEAYAREMLADSAGRSIGGARAQGFLASILGLRGEFDEARRHLDDARNELQEVGSVEWIAALGFMSQPLALASGDYEAAERDLRRALTSLEGTGERGWTATLSAELAILLFRSGRLDEAEAAARVARETTMPTDVNAESFWRCITGRILAERGQAAEGIRLLEEAIELNRTTDEIQHRAEMLVMLGEARELSGDVAGARRDLEEAVRTFDAKESLVAATRTRERLAELGS